MKIELNRDQIKYIAVFTMLLNHVANIFLQPGTFACEALKDIGYFTAPVMCWFLVEGYRYTRSVKKYAGSLLFNRLQKALQETLLKELVDKDIKMNVPAEQYPLISNFVAGGMISAYYEWITNPDGITLDEMARTLTTLIISGVHAFA